MEIQQKADMEKMQSDARHLQELSARKALEEKMAKVIKSLKVKVTSTLQELNSLSEEESQAIIKKLQKVEAKQKKQIER